MSARYLALASLVLALLLAPGSAPPVSRAAAGLEGPIDRAFAFSRQQLRAASGSIAPTRYPDYTDPSGAWITTDASAWTSGFFPGSLWLAYEQSGDPDLRAAARRWTDNLAPQQFNTTTHDVGFMIFSSYGNAYRLTGEAADRQVLLNAAASLASRYSPTVGSLRSWNSGPDEFKVIIDNMINLELLFWAARNGGQPAWRAMAISHALQTRANHMRPDGSTYQLIVYDPQTGAVKRRDYHQGHSADTTWSRGQAWAIYGFTVAYRESGDRRFLETARAAADYFLAHLPQDHVPYWDFQAPNIPAEPRDSAAAAVAAAGLLELSSREPDTQRQQRYLQAAEQMLGTLIGPAYLAAGSSSQAILLHGTPNKNRGRFDAGTSYGDYYLLQAMLRYRGLSPQASPTATATHTPTASATPTPTATPTISATPTATASATPTPTATATPPIGPAAQARPVFLPLVP